MLYKVASSAERGHLRNLIHRTNVPTDPQNNMNAAEDFLLLLLHTHVVAAADAIQANITSVESVAELARLIVVNYLLLPQDDKGFDDASVCGDEVYLYATELLTMALLWHGFHDSIREGDGERILRYWKFMLIIFKATNHRNYAKEAVVLLYQYYYLFSERQKHQLLWSRCVNTHGRTGTNIPCDLHMEHLNRRLKSVMRGMGSNITPHSITRAGKAIASVHHVCQAFERQTASSQHSDHHTIPEFGKDLTRFCNYWKKTKSLSLPQSGNTSPLI